MDPATQGINTAQLSSMNAASMAAQNTDSKGFFGGLLRDVQAFSGFNIQQANIFGKLHNPSPGIFNILNPSHPNGLIARMMNGIKAVLPSGWDTIQKPEVQEAQITYADVSPGASVAPIGPGPAGGGAGIQLD